MNEPESRRPAIEPATAHLFAAAALASPVMPVDFLVVELRRAFDATQWLAAAVRAAQQADLPLPAAQFDLDENVMRGDARAFVAALRAAPLESLDQLRRRAIVLYDAATDVNERNRAFAAYAIGVATALAEHGTMLSHQPRRDLDIMLTELAAALPPDIASVFERAAMSPVSLP